MIHEMPRKKLIRALERVSRAREINNDGLYIDAIRNIEIRTARYFGVILRMVLTVA